MTKKIIYFISNEEKTGIELALENKEDDLTICLIQNAVYSANKTEKILSDALSRDINVIACKEDVERRGLNKFIFEQVKLLSYGEIIDEVLSNDSIINI